MSSQYDDDNDPYHEKRLEEAYARDEENLRIEGDKRTLDKVRGVIEKYLVHTWEINGNPCNKLYCRKCLILHELGLDGEQK
jgi:hypothetical protein